MELNHMKYPIIFPEAMACRDFCVNLGNFIDGDSYLDDDLVICVSPCIWETHIGGYAYSCHIRGSDYHFEKEYKVKWMVGSSIPNGFSFLIEKAYEYDRLNYPKLCIFGHLK